MMQRTTELAEKIVRSPEGKKILNQVSPIYGNGRIGLWLFQIIGTELDELTEWIKEIALQAYPQTTTWAIDTWERQYGIPVNNTKSLKERRDLLMVTVRDRAPITPYKLGQMISALCGGINVQVVENIAANTFGIYLNTIPSHTNETVIRKTVDFCKPAHLIYEIGYKQTSVSINYWGAMLQISKKFQIRQVN